MVNCTSSAVALIKMLLTYLPFLPKYLSHQIDHSLLLCKCQGRMLVRRYSWSLMRTTRYFKGGVVIESASICCLIPWISQLASPSMANRSIKKIQNLITDYHERSRLVTPSAGSRSHYFVRHFKLIGLVMKTDSSIVTTHGFGWTVVLGDL
jgi:hypothetical protein